MTSTPGMKPYPGYGAREASMEYGSRLIASLKCVKDGRVEDMVVVLR